MPQPRTHKLRPNVAVARPGEMIVPNRLQQNSFNLLAVDLGGGAFGYKKETGGELNFANWRGWHIDDFQTESVADTISIHGEFVDRAPQALAGINLTYYEPTQVADRTVFIPFFLTQYELIDALLSTEIQQLSGTGVPFQCRLEIP